MKFPLQTREALTGRISGRRQFLTGKVILQEEVEIQTREWIPACPPPPNCKNITEWNQQERERIEKTWRPLRKYFRDAKPVDCFPVLMTA
jgi:hypothetical protein